ncbi:sialate O-acetylesterase [Pontiella sulfatireligans]|uniref:Sialate O-acetylesterase domain-containing protein n=1 Tax=Pontiella sulfatireligans TaxID=2750658 RepID=A0A6C2UGQ4_9BACT|nr:sialate O-acetylesterase [Pontiella sulfatireligans]VGO19392.1 hypothetical protein SCARR_01450 [Pontiella sulfatireligans]
MKVPHILMMALSGLLAGANAEFVVNGDFEADDITANNTVTNITGWTGNETGGALRMDYNISEIPENPNQVVRMTGNKWIRQDVSGSWSSNDVFTFSFNACEVSWKSGVAGNAVWAMLRNPANDTKYFSTKVVLDGTHGGSGVTYAEWQTNQTFSFEIPAYALIDGTATGSEGNATEGQDLRLYFYTTTDADSINWVDHISLTAVYGGPPPPLKLASPFQDGMVLQRGKPVKVWGTADPTNLVTVSINGTNAAAMSDIDGNWKVELPALSAGGPYELMTVSGSQTNTLTDVLVGDVWIAFGQSNMIRPLSEMTNKQTYIDDITTNRMIRCLEIAQDAALTPQESGSMTWRDNSNPGGWSSVAAVFAHQMHEGSGVPTAVIWAAWGSSSIEGWMPIQMADDFPHFDAMMDHYQSIGEYNDGVTTSSMLPGGYATNLEGIEAMINGSEAWNDVFIRTRPNIIYNQRIHPLLNFGISGFVWYQGEANAGTPENVAQYGFTLPAFVSEYRELFDQGDLPFLGVQLPSYNSTYWAWFRESQSRATALSNAYVAVTIDTGLVNNIHPYDKEPIGQRLALLGRKYALGEDLVAHGPTFESMSISGNEATITFSQADGLTTDDSAAPAVFELAGSDKVWHAATSSSISGTNVIISSSSEPAPVAVRYAWSPAPVNTVNLVNSDGLPSAPFRTDDWPATGLGAQAPMAVKDAYGILEGETLAVPAADGVLENDMDLNYDALSASLVADVAYGTLALLGDGSFTYTPVTGFTGNDYFTYAASDGVLSNEAAVTISVSPTNEPTSFVDSFDNDGLGLNLGEGGGMVNHTIATSFFSDDGNLTASGSGNGTHRASVYTANAFTFTNGFSLDVTYDIGVVNTEIADSGSFGLMHTTSHLDGLFIGDNILEGIGMSLTTRPTGGDGSQQGLNQFSGFVGSRTNLSNAQIVTAGTNKTFNLTVLADGSFTYSIDGAPATAGTTTLDLTKDYHFAAYTQRDAQFAIQSVSLVPIVPVTEIGNVDFEIQPGGTELGFSWYGQIGATYVLEATEDLVDGPWLMVTNIPGSGAPISVTEEMDKTNAFYRVYLAE